MCHACQKPHKEKGHPNMGHQWSVGHTPSDWSLVNCNVFWFSNFFFFIEIEHFVNLLVCFNLIEARSEPSARTSSVWFGFLKWALCDFWLPSGNWIPCLKCYFVCGRFGQLLFLQCILHVANLMTSHWRSGPFGRGYNCCISWLFHCHYSCRIWWWIHFLGSILGVVPIRGGIE